MHLHFVYSLNPEVLAVNQKSTQNRQLSREDDLIVWTADIQGSPDKFVALFNAQDNSDPFDLSNPNYRSPTLRGEPKQQVIDMKVSIQDARSLVLAVGDGGDGSYYDHAAWIEPTLSGPAGTLKLTDLQWDLATAGWGEVRKNRTVDNRPLTLEGKEVDGFGTHSVSVIEFQIPEGYDTFTSRGMITEGSGGKGSFEFLVLVDPEKTLKPEFSEVSVQFPDLEISGKARVFDLWSHEEIGVFESSFSRKLPQHSSGLFRISPMN